MERGRESIQDCIRQGAMMGSTKYSNSSCLFLYCSIVASMLSSIQSTNSSNYGTRCSVHSTYFIEDVIELIFR